MGKRKQFCQTTKAYETAKQTVSDFQKQFKNDQENRRSTSEEEHKGNALASGADEGRD